MSYMPKSKSDTHLTPPRVFYIIKHEWGLERKDFFDPCPANTPYKAPCFFNGLIIDWKKLNFVNPPYSNGNLYKFTLKAILETVNQNVTVMLMPSKTDQKWFHLLKPYWSNIVWIPKRLKFKNNKWAATQPHFLVIIR
jgi:hypothetical protein